MKKIMYWIRTPPMTPRQFLDNYPNIERVLEETVRECHQANTPVEQALDLWQGRLEKLCGTKVSRETVVDLWIA
jgi:hypothetical protein